MKKRKFGLAMSLVLAAGTILGACGSDDKKEEGSSGNKENDFSVAMVTDIGGVDDKSFNQSAWEGLQEFAKENDMSKGNGIDYLQSQSDADYATNLNTLVRNGNDLILGIGYALAEDIKEVAEQREDAHFAIVDERIEGFDNVASVVFKEHEGSFLVGVVAAMATESNKLGFIGGVDGELINKFEVGFIAGAKSVNPDIDVEVKYANSFGDATAGKELANTMYKSGVDVIYHASGGTGEGVFTAATELKAQDNEKNVWVIGVDRDQAEEGNVPGTDLNVTLTSMVKRVDLAVIDLSTKSMNGEFPGGKIIEYGLEEDAIGIAPTTDNVSEEAMTAVEEWTEKIKNGDVKVPTTRDELKEMKFEK